MKVTANMATVPSRISQCIHAIDSIAPQVDLVRVYCNGHTKEEAIFIKNGAPDNVQVFMSDSAMGDRGDIGKFYFADQPGQIYFSCDDDLLYPPDYVKHTIDQLNRYGAGTVLTYHGSELKHPVRDYYRDRIAYACLRQLNHDVEVDVGGSGVMCFNTDAIKVDLTFFEHPNMSDIYISALTKMQGSRIICLKHSQGWIKYMEVPDTIYDRHKNNCEIQTRVVNEYFSNRSQLDRV